MNFTFVTPELSALLRLGGKWTCPDCGSDLVLSYVPGGLEGSRPGAWHVPYHCTASYRVMPELAPERSGAG